MTSHSSLLFVDDNVLLTSTYGTLLAEQGFRVAEVSSGEQAVSKCAQEQTGSFALALVDMKMPGLDGPRTIAALRERAPTLRILAISGEPLSTYFAQLSDLGVRHFLPKPFRLEHLLAEIQDALAGPQGEREAVAAA